MYYRKIEQVIVEHLTSEDDRVLLVDGARQIGKSYIIRHIGQSRYSHYVEINMLEDRRGGKSFSEVKNPEEFYLQLSMAAKGNLGSAEDTLVFLDEIQVYPHLLTLLKFLRQDGRFTYIASGSMLGIALQKTPSIPMGSIRQVHMYPMDFEEFLLAYGISAEVISRVRTCFKDRVSPPTGVHEKFLQLFRYYLLCGGLPDAVKAFAGEQNIFKMREVQLETHGFYAADASQYDEENRLKIRSIFDSVPSLMENRKKRIVAKAIENKKGKMMNSYTEEFEYLTSAGIALAVKAVPSPNFPLTQGMEKYLLKLYLNDPGILTALLYGSNIQAILGNARSINLGSVYETAVACELKAHGFDLYYYDNRKKGEVDFLIDDYASLSVLPIEVKSGKDYSIHAALDRFVENEGYSVLEAAVFSDSGEIRCEGKSMYYPIYMCSFLERDETDIPALADLREIRWE